MTHSIERVIVPLTEWLVMQCIWHASEGSASRALVAAVVRDGVVERVG